MLTLSQRARQLAPPQGVALARGLLPVAAGLALALALHFWAAPLLGPYYAKVVIDVGIAIVLAVSLNLVNGFTGQFSIGHAGFMAVGAYAAAALVFYGSHRLWGNAAVHGGFLGAGEWLFAASCIGGGLVAAAAGYIVGLPSLRLRGDYLAIVTLGFGEIVRVLFTQTNDVLDDPAAIAQTPWVSFQRPPGSAIPAPQGLLTDLGGALGFAPVPPPPTYTSLFWVYTFVALTVLVAYRVKVSSYGRAFLSIRENEVAAAAMGIPVTRYKVRAFVLAAFFAGIAGGLFAHEMGTTLNPRELGFQKSFDIIIMVVLGGMGSISGAIVAAAALTVLPEMLREFQSYRMIVYALLLIVMMIVRPQGLFGLREVWELGPWRRFFGAGEGGSTTVPPHLEVGDRLAGESNREGAEKRD